MIRKDQLESINYLVEQYRNDLTKATIEENRLEEVKLQELAKEFVNLASFETNNLYVMQAVVEKTEIIRERVADAGLGTNKIHERFAFGFAKNENKLIEECLQAQARFGNPVIVRINPIYFSTYIEGTFKSDKITDIGVYAGVPFVGDDNVYSYVIEFKKE